ncbi:MAG: glycosyltransferase [Deltaproteobacteria bacterium]|nr:glycosyltransferase [Deltaproteobacteria bacterium]
MSLVIPVYNSANFIAQNIKVILENLETQPFESELILVNDGSRDNSLELLREIATQHTRVRVLDCGHNQGKGHAVGYGFREASGKFLVFNDADLAYPPDQVLRILKALEAGNDVAIACRVLPESRFEISPAFFRYLYTRHLMGRFFNRIVRWMVLPDILDSQAGLKGFTHEAAQVIFSRQTLKRFSFDVELLFIAQKLGLKVAQVPVNFRYFFEETTVRFAQDTLHMLRDLLKIRMNNLHGLYD